MKTFNTSLLAVAVGLALSTGAVAMTKEDHKIAKDRIEVGYKADKAACEALADNAKDICQAQAKGKENVAKAELEVGYKPSSKNRHDARVAKADAAYAVAKERCDDQKDNAKDVCVKEAKAAQTAAKADAKVADKVADARKDAAADKREAQLKLANAKCEALSGGARDSCMADAKANFGKI